MYNVKKCPECGSTNRFLNHDKRESICKDCGLVVKDEDKIMGYGPPWFTVDE